MEEYLNRIKLLSDQLKVKKIELPKHVIVAWLLNNLTPTYEGFVTMITQSYRDDSTRMNLENLFSNLLDESRWQSSIDDKSLTKVLYAKGP
jgi:hypothetical protein